MDYYYQSLPTRNNDTIMMKPPRVAAVPMIPVAQQEVLIAQLQEQHYQQYMQQVYQQQLLHQQQQYQQLQAMSNQSTPSKVPNDSSSPPQMTQANSVSPVPVVPGSGSPGKTAVAPGQVVKAKAAPESQSDEVYKATLVDSNGQPQDQHSSQPSEEEEADSDESQLIAKMPPLMPASMWTRKDIKIFKDTVRKCPDNVIKIGSLATATVRVPTHEDGTCLFWEFATDSYDLGFGVYFEWTISPSNQVSVHVSESSDEEELEDEEGGANNGPASPAKADDVEQGGDNPKKDNRPPTDEIIPVYRRDSHEEVYCGSHMYPGRGVYLLKFDNSYSLWRSKTLYYRVYYTR